MLVAGAVPLGLTFVLAYMPPPVDGGWAIACIFIAHLLFRTAYAGVNVPYLAMTARISADGGDRSFVAGMRMLFGTAAAVVVALSTVPLGAGSPVRRVADAYFAAAAVFAVRRRADPAAGRRHLPRSRNAARGRRRAASAPRLLSLARNRAFVALNAAMMAMIVAITVLNKSMLYYFKYVLNDPAAGQLALATMGLVSGDRHSAVDAARPVRRAARAVADRGGARDRRPAGVHRRPVRRLARRCRLFLVGMQVAQHRPQFRLLGDASEHHRIWRAGDRPACRGHGVRACSAAAADRDRDRHRDPWLGLRSARLRRQCSQQSAATLAGMRATIAVVPLLFLLLSCAAMLLNPLGRRARRLSPRRSARSCRWTPSLSAEGAIQTSKVPGSTVGRSPLRRRRDRAARSVNRTTSDWPGASAILRNAFSSRTGRVMLAVRSWM